MRLPAAVALLLLLVAAVPTAHAIDVTVPASGSLGPVQARPGEAVTLRAEHDLVLSAPIALPAGGPGQAGGDLVLEVSGTLWIDDGVRLAAGDGGAGPSDSGVGHVTAGDGGRGGDLVLRAQRIVLAGDAWLVSGIGGRGGDAEARGDPHGIARAGSGGDGGRITIEGEVIATAGRLHQDGGDGGDGGRAVALGSAAEVEGSVETDCPATDGAAATDDKEDPLTGDGAHAEAHGEAGGCGPPDGVGGRGGDAEAYGGTGGTGPLGDGGRGGDAKAFAGAGGRGGDACFATEDAAAGSGIRRAGNGGLAGVFTARAGHGGAGAATGGNGGNADGFSRGGNGGNGTFLLGYQSLFGSAPGREIIASGNGGPVSEGSSAIAGDGGPGTFGGGGGSAITGTHGGDGGFSCQIDGYTDDQAIPGPAPAGILLLVLVLGILARRRR